MSNKGKSVLQPWVHELTFMQQSVLIAAVRGPDGIAKNHPVKKLCRWLRRSFMLSAFDGKALNKPYLNNGGSFTGPSMSIGDMVEYEIANDDWQREMDDKISNYLECVDELPHHFQLHFMHAAEILGYKHKIIEIRNWWHHTYLRLCNDMHLKPEDEATMDKRLGDIEKQWREAEEVTAK